MAGNTEIRRVTIHYKGGRRDQTTYDTSDAGQVAAVAYLGAIVHTRTPIDRLEIEMHDGTIR